MSHATVVDDKDLRLHDRAGFSDAGRRRSCDRQLLFSLSQGTHGSTRDEEERVDQAGRAERVDLGALGGTSREVDRNKACEVRDRTVAPGVGWVEPISALR